MYENIAMVINPIISQTDASYNRVDYFGYCRTTEDLDFRQYGTNFIAVMPKNSEVTYRLREYDGNRTQLLFHSKVQPGGDTCYFKDEILAPVDVAAKVWGLDKFR